MKAFTSFLLQFVAAVLFISCNSTPGGQQGADKTTSSNPPTSQPVQAKPEMSLYMVKVDNLLLRDQATKNGSQVVSKFSAGEFVEGTGNVSGNKEEATIQGMVLNEPYVEVVSTTPEQKKGWAYGGALVQVFSGARKESPDLGKLTQFCTALKGLNTKKLESGKKIWDAAAQYFGDATGSLADAGFVLVQYYMGRLEMDGQFYNLTESIQWTDEDYKTIEANTFKPDTYPGTKKLFDNGFTLVIGEGQIFPVTDFVKLHLFFAGKVTPAMKDYLDQELVEFKVAAEDDGGIMIPLEEVLNRAVYWEKFNKKYPYFLLKERTVESEKYGNLLVINGSNNTPCYHFDDKSITEDYKKLWATAQQKYPDTQLAAQTKAMAELCAAEGWKHSPKVEAWVNEFVHKLYPDMPMQAPEN